MNVSQRRYILLLMFLITALFFSGCSNSKENFIETPMENIYVVDKANIINDVDKQEILKIGHELYEKTKGQVVVVTVNSLQGNNLEDITNQIFNQFGIGNKEKNNGVLLFIALEDKKMRIETGSGVDHILTDNKCQEELKQLKPYFKKQDYSTGILSVYKDLVAAVYLVDGNEEQANSILSTSKTNAISSASAENTSNDNLLLVLIALFIAAALPVKILIIVGILILLYILFKIFIYCPDILFFLLSGSSSSDSFGGGSSDGGGSSGDW